MSNHRALVRLAATALAAAAVWGTIATVPAEAATEGPTTYAGCPTSVPDGSLRDGSSDLGAGALCRQAVARAATPQAKLAIAAAFHMLGAPYACGGVGRMAPFRFDCSSLVSRAYHLGAGLDTAGSNWAPSTRDMVPWGGSPLADWAAYVAPVNLRPGDLVLYDTGGSTYRHVVMYIGNGYMLHTNTCGDVAHVSSFWGFPASGTHRFLVARRVTAPAGWTPPSPVAPSAPDTGSTGSSSSSSSTPVAPATNVPAFPGGVLGVGAVGPAVTALQKALIHRGYPIPALQAGSLPYGSFGQQTKDAVFVFQQEHSSVGVVNGAVTLAWYKAITGWVPSSTPTPVTTPATARTVSVAAVLAKKPAAVKVVQAALNKVVGANLRVDGGWGPRTQAAFNTFRQRVMGLSGAASGGAPGKGSLTALGRKAGFTVVA